MTITFHFVTKLATKPTVFFPALNADYLGTEHNTLEPLSHAYQIWADTD